YLILCLDACEPSDLRSCPTRRSSDLLDLDPTLYSNIRISGTDTTNIFKMERAPDGKVSIWEGDSGAIEPRSTGVFFPLHSNIPRSEEHTSELQSRENLVCRLLLEKRK